jgi:hypothetical protein
MAKDDWAIVVGIRSYPVLQNLDGPENDAATFRDWLLDPVGGNVPANHVQFITTSQWKTPFRSVDLARPTAVRVLAAVEKLQNIAEKKGAQGLEQRVGRRLYLYMAGHGFAPRDDQTGLLMANATPMRVGPGFHVLGEYTADWFYHAGYFDEIVLFMDCCREVYTVPALNMPYKAVNAPDAVERVKGFYGFGTKWSRLSRERPMANGTVHGVFTTALLAGLRGAAAEPNSGGQITTTSLWNYLRENMKTFLTPELLNNPEVPKQPDKRDYGGSFVLVTVAAPPAYPVTVHLPANSAGKKVNILGSPQFTLVASTNAAPPLWQLSLDRGVYMAQILADGLQSPPFEVTGVGGIDVNFQ